MRIDPAAHPSHLVLERPVREGTGVIGGVREHVLTPGRRHQRVQDFLGFALHHEFAFARPTLQIALDGDLGVELPVPRGLGCGLITILLFRSQQLATAVYQSELTYRLAQMGYQLESGRSGSPEIKGYSQEYLDASQSAQPTDPRSSGATRFVQQGVRRDRCPFDARPETDPDSPGSAQCTQKTRHRIRKPDGTCRGCGPWCSSRI